MDLSKGVNKYYRHSGHRTVNKPQWPVENTTHVPSYVTWIMDNLPGNKLPYDPEIFTDGSYGNETSIEGVFCPELAQSKASACTVFKDNSCDWKSKTVYVIHIHSGTALEVNSAYTI